MTARAMRWLYRVAFLGAIPVGVLVRYLCLRADQIRFMKPRHIGLFLVMFATSVALAPIELYERLRWRRALARTVVRDPVFIIGHWRSVILLVRAVKARRD